MHTVSKRMVRPNVPELWIEINVCVRYKNIKPKAQLLKHATDSGKTFFITECVYIFFYVCHKDNGNTKRLGQEYSA